MGTEGPGLAVKKCHRSRNFGAGGAEVRSTSRILVVGLDGMRSDVPVRRITRFWHCVNCMGVSGLHHNTAIYVVSGCVRALFVEMKRNRFMARLVLYPPYELSCCGKSPRQHSLPSCGVCSLKNLCLFSVVSPGSGPPARYASNRVDYKACRTARRLGVSLYGTPNASFRENNEGSALPTLLRLSTVAR